MRFDAINEIAKNLLIRGSSDEGHLVYHHGLRLGKLSKNMASALGIPFRPEVLYIAALFHDCAKGLPQVIENSWLAGEVLAKELEADLLGEICELIEIKESSASEDLPDIVWVMRDADIIDQFGTALIWSHFIKCYTHDTAFSEGLAFYEQGEFERRVGKERKLLHFELAKDIFDQRVGFCRDFAQKARMEYEGNLV